MSKLDIITIVIGLLGTTIMLIAAVVTKIKSIQLLKNKGGKSNG